MLEKYNEHRRQRYAADEEYRKRCIAKAMEWNRKHPDKVRMIKKKYRELKMF